MSAHNNDEGQARDVLAALYGEAPTLGPGESAAFEATRDLIEDHMRPASGEAGLSSASRQRVMDALSQEPPARVGVLTGAVWIRRAGAASALPLGDDREVRRGDTVLTTAGTRAMVRLADGSSVMLAEESELVIGAPAGMTERLSLLGGRLYAWVEKQRDALFAIRTPHGFACVVGTEFDLQSDREGNLALIVTEGQVNFRPASGNMQEVALRRNEMYESRITSSTKRTLPSRETGRLTAWAKPARRGQISATTVALVALGMCGAATILYGVLRDKSTTLPPSPPLTQTVVTNAANPPAENTQQSVASSAALGDTFDFHFIQPGGENSVMTSSKWTEVPVAGKVEYRMKIRTTAAAGANQLRMQVEYGDVLLPDGTSYNGPENSYRNMAGFAFSTTRGADGNFANAIAEREDKAGSDGILMAIILATLNMQPQSQLGLKPGGEFHHATGGKYSFMPGGTWKTDHVFKLEGFGELDGVPVAYIASRGTMTFENVILSRTVTPAYTQDVVATRMVVEDSTRSAYDRSNSKMIGAVGTSNTKLNMEIQIRVQGREPIIRPLPTVDQTESTTVDVEYQN